MELKSSVTLNGKSVFDIEVDGVDPRDYPDFSDAYFSYACWSDGTPLNEDEMDALCEQEEELLWEMAYESTH